MKRSLSNRKQSLHAVLAVFETTDTSTIPGLPEIIASCVSDLNLAETLEQRQAKRLEPVLEVRDRALQAMALATVGLAGRVVSFARRKGDAELAADIKTTPSDFARVRIDGRVRVAQHVHDVVAARLPQLAESGVTAAEVAALQTKIADARAVLALPRSLVVEKAQATVQLDAVYRRLINTVVQQLDPLMLALRETNEALYGSYKRARIVIDRSGKRRRSTEDSVPASAIPVTANEGSTMDTNSKDAEVKLAA